MEQVRATTLEQLQEYAKGNLVRLPDLAPGMPLVVYMRRPSMLDLIAQGKIPNPLLHTAAQIFSKGGRGVDSADPQQLQELTKILHVFCEVSFVSPTYKQIKEAGLTLTDEQLMFVFNYVQRGTKALEKFRSKPQGPQCNGDGAEVQEDAVGDTED